MNKPDKFELGALDPISWGVQKYYLVRTDEQLAIGLSTTVEEIQRVMADLGLVREAGKESMKEFAREWIKEMPRAEKLKRLGDMDFEKVWEMAEGKAPTTGELTVNNEPVKIDITHHLLKTYEPITGSGESPIDVPFSSTEGRVSEGSGQ